MDELTNVLFLMPKRPYPPHEDGAVLIYYHMIKYLRNINIMYLVEPSFDLDENVEKYFANNNIINLNIKDKNNLTNQLSFVNGYDVNMNKFYYSDKLNCILNFIRKYNIRKVVCNISLLRYAEKIKFKTNCEVYLHSIDAMSMVEYSKYIKSKGTEKLKSFLKYAIYSRIERNFDDFDKIFVVSDIDNRYLISKNKSLENKVYTISNGVDTDYFFPKQKNYDEVLRLGFSGIMDYFPNEDAVIKFMNGIFPHLRSIKPNIEYWIIGKNPTDLIIKNAQKFGGKVIVTGFVNDIREYLSKIDIYVSNLESGGGIKNKVLEAMSMGLPVVASETSVSGLLYNSEMLVYKNNRDMINKIEFLINNPKRALEMSVNSRRFVIDNYSWEKKIRQYYELIRGRNV